MTQIDAHAPAREGSSEMLSILIGAQEFALDIRAIREIRGWIDSIHLPHAPSYVKGMINLRGSVLLVIDLAERLGLQSRAANAATVVVVVETPTRVVGLLVDAVCDIITVTDDMCQPIPETGTTTSREYIEGLIMMDSRIISILAIAKLMPDGTVQALAEAA